MIKDTDLHSTQLFMSMDTQVKELQFLAWAGLGEEGQDLVGITGSFIL